MQCICLPIFYNHHFSIIYYNFIAVNLTHIILSFFNLWTIDHRGSSYYACHNQWLSLSLPYTWKYERHISIVLDKKFVEYIYHGQIAHVYPNIGLSFYELHFQCHNHKFSGTVQFLSFSHFLIRNKILFISRLIFWFFLDFTMNKLSCYLKL